MPRAKGVVDKNKCVNCPHFRIIYEPLGSARNAWDFGMAECKKHGRQCDFFNRKDLDKLRCMEPKEDCYE